MSGSFTVLIKDLSGRTTDIQCGIDTTIEDFFSKINDKIGYPNFDVFAKVNDVFVKICEEHCCENFAGNGKLVLRNFCVTKEVLMHVLLHVPNRELAENPKRLVLYTDNENSTEEFDFSNLIIDNKDILGSESYAMIRIGRLKEIYTERLASERSSKCLRFFNKDEELEDNMFVGR